jgi:hypothetical protein
MRHGTSTYAIGQCLGSQLHAGELQWYVDVEDDSNSNRSGTINKGPFVPDRYLLGKGAFLSLVGLVASPMSI